MSLRSQLSLLGIVALAAYGSAACIVEEHHNDYGGGGYASPPQSTGTGSGSAQQPLLVDVDTGKVMSATPGDGVGVFVEYAAGGHWHVWWTCDTNVSGQSCAMDVRISVATGAIGNAKIQDGSSTSTQLATRAASLEATSTTTTTIDGVDFDTSGGAAITVDAAVGGIRDGKFLFFVQNGQVNGGYQGTLTDPLQLEPSSP